jgi:hypothetical protein
VSNPQRSLDRHDALLSDLFFEIRKDLAIRPRDKLSEFRVLLWSVGKKHFEP